MPERQTYLNFTEVPNVGGRKTKVWRVMSTSGNHLGMIKWFGRWRCYCFFPNLDTVFNDGCLEDLTDFCRNETRAHRSAAKYEREHDGR